MKKQLALTFLAFFCQLLFAQQRLRVAVDYFTCDNQKCRNGEVLSDIFENVLSNFSFQLEIVERKKIETILLKMQEQKMLSVDFKISPDEPQLALVDYIARGNLITEQRGDKQTLIVDFIKIRGDGVTVKDKSIWVTLLYEDLNEHEKCRNLLANEIRDVSFDDKLGVISKEQLELIRKDFQEQQGKINTLNEVVNKLENESNDNKKQVSDLSAFISNLSSENARKEKQIVKLSSEVTAVKEYADMAELDIYGLGNFKGGDGISISSPLNSLMKQILTVKEGKAIVKDDEQAKSVALEVVNKYPRFPFGYYAVSEILRKTNDPEWKTYADKAIKIFEMTTMIAGHNPQHDQGLEFLRKSTK